MYDSIVTIKALVKLLKHRTDFMDNLEFRISETEDGRRTAVLDVKQDEKE